MKIKDFKDKHKGKIGFIAGAGPSARHVDPDVLSDHVVFSVNSSIKKFNKCDYYVIDDWDVMNWDYFDYARGLDCTKLLYRKHFSKHESLFRPDNYVFYSHKEYAVNGIVQPQNLKLSKSEPIIGARTVAASAIHLAYTMGCDPIVLIGVDCKYEDDKRYFWQFPGEEMCYRKDGKQYNLPTNEDQKDTHCIDFVEYWKYFSDINSDMNICNLKSTGQLDIFKEVTLGDIL